MENEEIKNNPEAITEIKKKSFMNLPGAVVIASLIIAAAIMFPKVSAQKADTSAPDKLDLVADVTDADFIRGNNKAEITIIEYADFSCHFCAQYHPTLQKIVADYKGRVRWVYRNLPIFNMPAAVAGQCVGNLAGDEAFWNFADTMFANPKSRTAEFYRETALTTGVSPEEYDSCVNGIIVKDGIQKSFNQARTLLGFNATPYTILIDKDGRKFSFAGALPYEDVKGTVDMLLGEK